MMVVAIIGILASVALPNFANAQARAKKSERDIVIEAVARGVEVYIARNASFPSSPWPTGATWNPAVAPGTTKRPLDVNSPGWREIEVEVDGGVYYQYRFLGQAPAGQPMTLVVGSQGDLDGDNVWSTRTVSYQFDAGAMRIMSDVRSPPYDNAF
jgi:type II secretory pathway pseudopilin PulG